MKCHVCDFVSGDDSAGSCSRCGAQLAPSTGDKDSGRRGQCRASWGAAGAEGAEAAGAPWFLS